MNIIIRECEDCNDLQQVLSDVECTILDITNNRYNSLIYGVDVCEQEELYKDLIILQRIITARLYNCSYPCTQFSSNEILAKARLLAYKTSCSRCPECEPIIIPTTTTTFPPGSGSCVTYLLILHGHNITISYTYIDCEGVVQFGEIGSGDILFICAIQYSLSISPIVIVIEASDECEEFSCLSYLLTNIRESGPANYNYTDCEGSPVIAEIFLPGGTLAVCSQDSLSNTSDVSVELTGGCNS